MIIIDKNKWLKYMAMIINGNKIDGKIVYAPSPSPGFSTTEEK